MGADYLGELGGRNVIMSSREEREWTVELYFSTSISTKKQVSCPVRLPPVGPLVTGRPGDFVGLRAHQYDKRLFDLLTDQPVELRFEHVLVDMPNLIRHGSAASFH